MSEESKLLLRAANELKSYIDDVNANLKATIKLFDEVPPDYHDYQTCQDLADLAKKLEGQDGWISVDVRTPNYGKSTQLDVFINGEIDRAYWEPNHKVFAFTSGMVTHWRPMPQPPTTSTPPTHEDG